MNYEQSGSETLIRRPSPAAGDDHQLCDWARAFVTLADQVLATTRCPKIFFTTTAPVRTAFQLVIWQKDLLKDGKIAAQWWKDNLEIFVRVASHRRLNASRRSVCTIRKQVAILETGFVCRFWAASALPGTANL
jgi:hypothetical protein